jgi:hypothetical protein
MGSRAESRIMRTLKRCCPVMYGPRNLSSVRCALHWVAKQRPVQRRPASKGPVPRNLGLSSPMLGPGLGKWQEEVEATAIHKGLPDSHWAGLRVLSAPLSSAG